MRKIIEYPHHVHAYECMWNGVEDFYMNKTKEVIPPSFFFLLGALGSFCLLKTSGERKRMISLGDGRTHKMFEFLAPLIGFEYKIQSYSDFDAYMKKTKKEIDLGYPVLLGALDMYYLPYHEKIYHKKHIPFHYLMMNGYDEEKKLIYFFDNSRSENLSLPYESFEKALNCSYPGLSKPYTLISIRMGELTDKYTLSKKALTLKAQAFLNPKASFLGYKGMEKLDVDLDKWNSTLTKKEIKDIVTNLIEFFGSVPTLLTEISNEPINSDVTYRCNFDKFAYMLEEIGNEYNDKSFLEAKVYFEQCGLEIEALSKDIIKYYYDDSFDIVSFLKEHFRNINKNMQMAFRIILQMVY